MSALIAVNAFFSCTGYRTGDRRRTGGSKDKNKDSTGINPYAYSPYRFLNIAWDADKENLFESKASLGGDHILILLTLMFDSGMIL